MIAPLGESVEKETPRNTSLLVVARVRAYASLTTVLRAQEMAKPTNAVFSVLFNDAASPTQSRLDEQYVNTIIDCFDVRVFRLSLVRCGYTTHTRE